MKKNPTNLPNRKPIENRSFQKLFLKNWLLVFICIVLPLCLGVFAMQHFSNRSLLQEVDAAANRSADNATATIRTLIEEACSILKTEVLDENVTEFFRQEHSFPVTYRDVANVQDVLTLINGDLREPLYFSLDVYSAAGDRVASTNYGGQSYPFLRNENLKEVFQEYTVRYPNQTLFAQPRIAWENWQTPVRVITVYQTNAGFGDRSFASVSISQDKLLDYITDTDISEVVYLLLDSQGTVMLDSSGAYSDTAPRFLSADLSDYPMTQDVDGRSMRIMANDLGHFGWTCVQMVPVEALEANSIRLQRIVALILVFGVVVAFVISHSLTSRLFHPIQAILRLLEDPKGQLLIREEDEEYRYLLVQILELFQQNITLESEMADRIVALRSARAKALQEQMTPHFLNNTLQAINWLAIMETKQENSRTSQALTLLADVIRTNKEQRTNLVTVEEEVAYTHSFVELEKLRYGDGIRCDFRVEPGMEQAHIPGISLQCMVENAILHGFRPRDGIGRILVSVDRSEEGGLRIRVEDDGVGINPEVTARIFGFLQEEYIYLGEHLGLVNLFQRFRLVCGEGCGFDIRQSRMGGACIEIITPPETEWLRLAAK